MTKTPCEEARDRRDAAQATAEREREVLWDYQEQYRTLENEHADLERRWTEASGLVVQNERDWEVARETLRKAIDDERTAEQVERAAVAEREKYDRGERTKYSGEPNERALLDRDKEVAYDALMLRRTELRTAEGDVRTAKDRHDRSRTFLQERADAKFANEDAQRTKRSQIAVQQETVNAAEQAAGAAQQVVDRVC